MINDHERSFFRWKIADLTTQIEINKSNRRVYCEIMDLADSGVISDREFIAIVRRIT